MRRIARIFGIFLSRRVPRESNFPGEVEFEEGNAREEGRCFAAYDDDDDAAGAVWRRSE
jgi:hypothetical protein